MGYIPKKTKYATITKENKKVGKQISKLIAPPTKQLRKLPLYDFKYKGIKTNTDDTTVQKISTKDTYDPNIKNIATKPADIADNAKTLLFITYNTCYKAYPYNTKQRRK